MQDYLQSSLFVGQIFNEIPSFGVSAHVMTEKLALKITSGGILGGGERTVISDFPLQITIQRGHPD